MKEIPKHIIDRLESYYKHSQKAEKLRLEIEQWFTKQGMKMIDDVDTPITDILVDLAIDGDIEECIEMLNTELNLL